MKIYLACFLLALAPVYWLGMLAALLFYQDAAGRFLLLGRPQGVTFDELMPGTARARSMTQPTHGAPNRLRRQRPVNCIRPDSDVESEPCVQDIEPSRNLSNVHPGNWVVARMAAALVSIKLPHVKVPL